MGEALFVRSCYVRASHANPERHLTHMQLAQFLKSEAHYVTWLAYAAVFRTICSHEGPVGCIGADVWVVLIAVI